MKISKQFGNDWSPETLDYFYRVIEDIAVGEWGYDIYPNQIEIVTSEGMIEAYSSVGMPIYYPHWSFGKSIMDLQKNYKHGKMGLAYELVINSDPCISYLMEENTLTMQVLVIAHACMGHNHFFKNNHLFKQWTMADYIIDYLRFAKHFVEHCEQRYGYDEVERVLDAAHALSNYSVDKYKRKKKRKSDIEDARRTSEEWDRLHYDRLVDTDEVVRPVVDPDDDVDVEETENILYFIEKQSPVLKQWQRELVRIVRKIGEYYYPQRHTKIGNEGFATWTHYNILNELDKRGYVDEAFMLEFLHSHSSVLYQPDYRRSGGSFNPYKLGFEMIRDIERICTEPTKEDEEWFPSLVGTDPKKAVFEAVRDYKDESFITQFLSPKVIRDFRMFTLKDEGEDADTYMVSAIHDDEGYKHIRSVLSKTSDVNYLIPQISVKDVKWRGDRTLTLKHTVVDGRTLDVAQAKKVVEHVKVLWGFDVTIHEQR